MTVCVHPEDNCVHIYTEDAWLCTYMTAETTKSFIVKPKCCCAVRQSLLCFVHYTEVTMITCIKRAVDRFCTTDGTSLFIACIYTIDKLL